MDVVYFLRERTSFIRYFHDNACAGFEKIKSDIEDGKPPFEDPPFDPDQDSPEPPYQIEWMDADTGLQMVRISAVSMLSDTLKIYFRTLQQEIGFAFDDKEKAAFKNEGFIAGYKMCLGDIFSTDWSDCAVRFDIIEQVVLARNRAQHGQHLEIMRPTHDHLTLNKHPRPFFVSESEKAYLERSGEDGGARFFLALEIERADLFLAIEQVEHLATWLQGREAYARDWSARQRAARKQAQT